MPNFCECGYHATTLRTRTITCPLCGNRFRVKSKEDLGREAWNQLHSQREPTPAWYKAWTKSIPKYGCNCRSEWKALTAKFPPDFSSPEAFARWAVDRHNDINIKLGKPTLEVLA